MSLEEGDEDPPSEEGRIAAVVDGDADSSLTSAEEDNDGDATLHSPPDESESKGSLKSGVSSDATEEVCTSSDTSPLQSSAGEEASNSIAESDLPAEEPSETPVIPTEGVSSQKSTSTFDKPPGKEEEPKQTQTPTDPSLTEIESRLVGGEIIFPNDNATNPSMDPTTNEWTNLKWLSTSGTRKICFSGVVTRLMPAKKTGIFSSWAIAGTSAEDYVRRKIVIYEEPSLILILRKPTSAHEVRKLLDIPPEEDIGDPAVVVRSYFVAESVMDPKACKLRLSPLTTITSIENGHPEDPPRRRTCFQLLTPIESIELSAIPARGKNLSLVNNVAFLETTKMEVAITKALVAAHQHDIASGDQMAAASWKHQLVLGTLHSFVVSGSVKLLKQAIAEASVNGKVSSRIIDAVDASGQTPLHYACLRRASAMVHLLVGAGADCTLPIEVGGSCYNMMTPLHLSAKVLDDKSLSTILGASSTSHRRIDPNCLDSEKRTPMYVAILKGESSIVGNSDDHGAALGRCIAALEAWGGVMRVPGSMLPHPVETLVSNWHFETLEAVFSHLPFRYPLMMDGAQKGSSLSAMYNYPIHTALLSLRKQLLGSSADTADSVVNPNECGDARKVKLLTTLKLLHSHGFEPNERIESSENIRLSPWFGFSPLQLLGLFAVELLAMSKSEPRTVDANTEEHLRDMIVSAVDFLVRNGARWNVDAPPTNRLNRAASSISEDEGESSNENKIAIYRKSLKLDQNKRIIEFFGGLERLTSARKVWTEAKSVKSVGKAVIRDDKADASPANCEAPGGSDEKSCSICWRGFSLMLRRHRCRISQRFVCDECSTKRIVVDEKQHHRVSDGQFLLARADVGRNVAEKLAEQERKREEAQQRLEDARRARQAKDEEEQAGRETLFGNIMEKATTFVLGEEAGGEYRQDDGIQGEMGGLQHQLGQTMNALNERGNKLNDLSEKTAQLVDSSAEFAKLAKELEKSQRGWFS